MLLGIEDRNRIAQRSSDRLVDKHGLARFENRQGLLEVQAAVVGFEEQRLCNGVLHRLVRGEPV